MNFLEPSSYFLQSKKQAERHFTLSPQRKLIGCFISILNKLRTKNKLGSQSIWSDILIPLVKYFGIEPNIFTVVKI